MTCEYLESVLPGLLNTGLGGLPHVQLASLAKAYAALWEYAATGTETLLARNTQVLFDTLERNCAFESDPVLRGRMIGAMYLLACGTQYAADHGRECRCRRAADAYIGEYLREEGPVRTMVCRCIAEVIYPCPDPRDEYLCELKKALSAWADTLRREDCWPGVQAIEALERIGLMDRCAYLFPDAAYGDSVGRAFAFYLDRVAIPEEIGNFDPASLPLLTALYDVAAEGSTFCGADTARRIARFLCAYGQTLPAGSDERSLCVACAVHGTVRELLRRRQDAALAHTA